MAFKVTARAALPLAGRLIPGFFPRSPEFNLRAFHMGFVVDKSGTGTLFYSFVIIIPPVLVRIGSSSGV